MNYNDVIALVRAGYTKEEISAMSVDGAQNQPAPAVIQPAEPQKTPAPSAAPAQPAPAPAPAAAPAPAPAPAAAAAPAAAPAPAAPTLPPKTTPNDPYSAMFSQILAAIQQNNLQSGRGPAPVVDNTEDILAGMAGYEIQKEG